MRRIVQPIPVLDRSGQFVGWCDPFDRRSTEDGAITTWDGVCAAGLGGKRDWHIGFKNNANAVASYIWMSRAFRAAGMPAAGSYTNVPGGATFNSASTGAIPLIDPGDDDAYLLELMGGTGYCGGDLLLVDLLVAAGNISANTTAATTVNTSALTRYTDGVGVMMTLEVTTVLSGNAANVTIGYTNTADAAKSTGAIAMTVSAVVDRIQPSVQQHYAIPLASGDVGVKSVQTVTFSAAMGGGVVAVLLFKPLAVILQAPDANYITMSSHSLGTSLDGILRLQKEAGGALGCLTWFTLRIGSTADPETLCVNVARG